MPPGRLDVLHGCARLLSGLEVGDVNPQISTAWIAAQDLHAIYLGLRPVCRPQRLHRWLTYFDTGGISNRALRSYQPLIKR